MTDPESAATPLANVSEILAILLAPQQDPVPLADRLCAACVAALDISGAGLILMNEQENLGLVAATPGPATQLEELQFTTGEGPCVDASRSGRPVLQPALQSTALARWPGFGSAVLGTSICAAFAFPLKIGAIRIGVLDLYRDAPGELSEAQLVEALAYADAATLLLLNLLDRGGDSADGTQPVVSAIDNHAVVHQATGMIAVQLNASLAEALLRLRAHAYASGRSLTHVSIDVVDRRMRFDDTEFGASVSADN